MGNNRSQVVVLFLAFYLPVVAFALCLALRKPQKYQVSLSHDPSAAIAGLVSCIPLGIDVVVDIATYFFGKSSSLPSIASSVARLLIFAAMLGQFLEEIFHPAEFSSVVAVSTKNVAAAAAAFSLISLLQEEKNHLCGKCLFFLQSLGMMATFLGLQILASIGFFEESENIEILLLVALILMLLQMVIFAVSWSRSLYGIIASKGVCRLTPLQVNATSYFFCIFVWLLVRVFAGNLFFLKRGVERSDYIDIGLVIAIKIVSGLSNHLRRLDLEAQIEQRNTFTRYVSHEIRTPLNTVSLGIAFVKLELEKALAELGTHKFAAILETLYDASDSCQVAMDTLNELLLFDKLECGKMTVDLEPMSPWQFLTDCCRQFRQIAAQREIDFRVECKGEDFSWIRDCFVRVDETKFSQVMRNLISNAFKFTPDGGTIAVTASVLPSTSASFSAGDTDSGILATSRSFKVVPEDSHESGDRNRFLRIEVVDNGVGISPENQTKLFGQYVQFDANALQSGGGSGLGLWITKGIMEMHGGRIGAASLGEGLGTSFFVELPLFPVSELSLRSRVDHWSGRGMKSKRKTDRLALHKSPTEPNLGKNEGQRAVEVVAKDPPEKSSKESSLSRISNGIQAVLSNFSSSRSSERDKSNDLSRREESGEARLIASSVALTEQFRSWATGMNFLVVDDSTANRKVTKRLLCCHGHSVVEAFDGAHCVEILEQEYLGLSEKGKSVGWYSKFDVILMDDQMPNLSGHQATRRLREMNYRGVIIGVTGNTAAEDVARYFTSGASAVLAKPLNLDQLKAAVIQHSPRFSETA